MSASTVDYAKINCAVKKGEPWGEYVPQAFKYSTGFINNGFWGCTYVNETTKEVIICFKGTGSAKVDGEKIGNLKSFNTDDVDDSRPNKTIVQDLTADLKLMLGVIPNQASTARKLFKRSTETWDPSQYAYSITGHSLGGYLAQVVAYWYNLPSVTFNAPGAWGDLQRAKLNFFKPQVMWRTIKATFQWEPVSVNFMHTFDIIGNYGIHRGRTFRVLGGSHMMKAICKTLENHERWSNCSPFDTRKGFWGLWDRI
jgi:hypothetical protein